MDLTPFGRVKWSLGISPVHLKVQILTPESGEKTYEKVVSGNFRNRKALTTTKRDGIVRLQSCPPLAGLDKTYGHRRFRGKS